MVLACYASINMVARYLLIHSTAKYHAGGTVDWGLDHAVFLLQPLQYLDHLRSLKPGVTTCSLTIHCLGDFTLVFYQLPQT